MKLKWEQDGFGGRLAFLGEQGSIDIWGKRGQWWIALETDAPIPALPQAKAVAQAMVDAAEKVMKSD